MTCRRSVLVVATLLMLAPSLASAQQNPLLGQLLAKKVKAELSKVNSPDRGFRDGPHWLHFDNPAQNLFVTLNVNKKERLELTGRINAKVVFNFHAVKSKTVLGRRIVIFRRDMRGTADAVLALNASAIGGDRLSDAKVQITDIKLHNLRMNNDLARPFSGVIEKFVNRALNGKKQEFEGKLVQVVNSFDYSLTSLAKKTVVAMTKGEKFPVVSKQPAFSGSIAFVDPESNLKVEVKDFDLKNDTVSIIQQSTTKLHIVGELKDGDLTIPLDLESDIIILINGQSQLVAAGEAYALRSRIDTADVKMVVTKVNQPKELPGGTAFASALLNSVVNTRMSGIIKAVNGRIASTPFNP